jgi:hypothetical protein
LEAPDPVGEEAIVNFPRAALHPPVLKTPRHRALVADAMAATLEASSRASAGKIASGPSIQIPLSTVSRASNFDAEIGLRFGSGDGAVIGSLIVDTGSDALIVPSFDAISASPNFASDYKILLDNIKEPFDTPAKLLSGPIVIPTPDGDFTIEDCSFFACTGPDARQNTAIFGAGWISRWRIVTDDQGTATFTVRPPLRIGTSPYRYVEFDYAPEALENGGEPRLAAGSTMTLRKAPPPDFQAYQMFEITRDDDVWWMSLKVKSVTIGDKRTEWPKDKPYPIAMVDTGGGPVLLGDPDGYFYKTHWPEQVEPPDWAKKGPPTFCQAVKGPLTIEIGDEKSPWFSYRIDTTQLPKPVQGLTLVLCKECKYLFGRPGINIGGISALFNHILIDNESGQVGFKSRQPLVA